MMTMRRWRDERGAVLVQTAVAAIGLLAFGSLTMDYGVLWVARGQAQNAADAGALAAATSMAYGDSTAVDFETRVKAVGVAAAQSNLVWGAAPDVQPADVTIITCPPGSPGIPDQCVRVNVYRNQERGNALPTFFAQLVGVMDHGVKATATAQVAAGVSSECVRPWAIPDKWIDRLDADAPVDVNTWTLEDTFNRYQKVGPTYELMGPIETLDEYVPASTGDPGSGFTVPDDVGMRVRLKIGNPQDVDIAAGNFLPIDLPLDSCGENCPGGKRYEANIANCNGTTLQVGDMVWTEPGNMVGPTNHGVDELIAKDPGAVWMCSDGSVASPSSDCAGYVSTGASPRLVPVPIFNVQAFQESVAQGDKGAGKLQLQITRLVGFFIEEMIGNDVVGRVTYYPTASGIGNNTLPTEANFLRKILLVR